MKRYLSGGALAALAGAAMLLPLAAAPASAQVPGGSYTRTCRDIDMRGDRVVATCRTEEGRWNRTAIDGVGQCAGGLANADGRLVCGTGGGGWNVGRARGGHDRREYDRDYGGRRDRYQDGYGNAWGGWQNTPGWYYGR